MAKKIIAILLALSFVFAFAACGGKDDDATTTAPSTTEDIFAELDDTTAAADESTTAADESTTVADESTTAADESTTAADESTTAADTTKAAGESTTAATTKAAGESTTKATTKATTAATTKAAANAMPQGTEAIVEYYNTAINNAKKNSKSITSNYMKHAVAGEITGIPSALDSIGQTLIKDNMGEDESKKNVTWTTAEDKNAFFPVENETYASKLTAADVKEAKIVEKDGKYIIRITTKDDARSETHKHGAGHAPKAFNAVLPGLIDGYIPGIAKSLFSVGTVATAYPASTVQITVDAATGNVVSAHYMLYWTLYIPLNGTDVVLPFSTENDYTINW